MAYVWKPGDRVFRGFDIHDIQPLTVVRVNRKTITVRTDQGSVFRLPPQDIAGAWIDDEAA